MLHKPKTNKPHCYVMLVIVVSQAPGLRARLCGRSRPLAPTRPAALLPTLGQAPPKPHRDCRPGNAPCLHKGGSITRWQALLEAHGAPSLALESPRLYPLRLKHSALSRALLRRGRQQ